MLNLLFGSPGRRAAGPAKDSWPPNSGSGRRRTQSGAVVDEDLALTYAAVWCATRIICETCSSLPLFLYKRKENDDREHASTHDLYSILKDSPNPQMGSMPFREGRTMHQVNWGNGFAEIERERFGDPTSRVKALWPIHPGRVRPIGPNDRDERGRLLSEEEYAYAVRNNDGRSIAMKASEVLHVPGVLSEDGIWGKGVISYARELVGFGISTERHGATYFGTGGQPRGIAFLPGMKDPEARKQFRQEWRELHGHPDSAEIAILPPEGKFEKVMISNEDAQFLGTRVHNDKVVAQWYRVPVYMLAHLDRSGYGSIEHMGLEFVIYSILPWLRRWEEQINLKLLTPQERRDYYAEHQLAGLLRGDIQARMNAYKTAIGTGIMTINEARRLENLNGIGSAGDVHYVPLNMTTAERMMKGEVEQAKHGSGPGSDQTGAPDDGGPGAQALQLFDRWTRRLVKAIPAKQEPIQVNLISPAKGEAGPETVAPLPSATFTRSPGPGMRRAAGGVLRDVLRRMLTKEANAARRKAKSPDFETWLVEFHREHREDLAVALTPAVELLKELGSTASPESFAARVADDSLVELRRAYGSDTPDQFAQRLDVWAERAGSLVDRFMAEVPEAKGEVAEPTCRIRRRRVKRDELGLIELDVTKEFLR